ncbi:MAG: H-type lectin domain-containing protein [Acidobacteria bacterium]|nr:H-type lectin domain-containing protein [Acidobacteriota bacterium]
MTAALQRTCHGVLEVPDPSSVWTLDPATEQCLYTARVAFSEPFVRAPHVVAGLSALELGTAPGPAARLEVRIVPGTVSRSGFTIRFATRAGASVESAAAFWLAMSA